MGMQSVFTSIEGRIFHGLQHLIETRKNTTELHARAETRAVWTTNEQVLGLLRNSARGQVLVLANFSEQSEVVPTHQIEELGFAGPLINLLDGTRWESPDGVELETYDVVWLQSKAAR